MFAGFLFSFYLCTRFHFVTKRNSLLLSFVDSMRKWLQLWHDFVSPTPHLHVFLTMQVVSASSSLSHCSLVLRNSVATVASVLLFYCLSLAFYAAKAAAVNTCSGIVSTKQKQIRLHSLLHKFLQIFLTARVLLLLTGRWRWRVTAAAMPCLIGVIRCAS